jgi:hypothetical protein
MKAIDSFVEGNCGEAAREIFVSFFKKLIQTERISMKSQGKLAD